MRFWNRKKYKCEHEWFSGLYKNDKVYHCMKCHWELFVFSQGYSLIHPKPRMKQIRINNLILEFEGIPKNGDLHKRD
jgi:hypothetical protein